MGLMSKKVPALGTDTKTSKPTPGTPEQITPTSQETPTTMEASSLDVESPIVPGQVQPESVAPSTAEAVTDDRYSTYPEPSTSPRALAEEDGLEVSAAPQAATSQVTEAKPQAATLPPPPSVEALCKVAAETIRSALTRGVSALQKLAMPTAEESTSSASRELRDIIQQASLTSVTLAPGEVLIREGQPSGALYLLVSGSLVLSRKNKQGRQKTVATLREGAILGELSFLLGTTSNVTVAAKAQKPARSGGFDSASPPPTGRGSRMWGTPRSSTPNATRPTPSLLTPKKSGRPSIRPKTSTGSGDGAAAAAPEASTYFRNAKSAALAKAAAAKLSEQTIVAKLDNADAQRLTTKDPKLMLRFFRAMAANISRRVLDTTASSVLESQPEQNQEANKKLAARSAFDLAKSFGIAALDERDAADKLTTHIPSCTITSEGGSERQAAIYIFRDQLCIEESLMMFFTNRRAISFTEILNVRLLEAETAESGAVEIQMLGTSMQLKMPKQEASQCSKTLENHRLKAVGRKGEHARGPHRSSVALPSDVKESALAVVARQTDSLVHSTAGESGASSSSEVELMQVTKLTEDEWRELLQGSRYMSYQRDERILEKGAKCDGLLEVVGGTIRIEVEVPGRAQAQVVNRLVAGDILGEMSLLLGTVATATAVCESEQAATIRLPTAYLTSLFNARPELAGKFYCFLAVRAASRLRGVTTKDDVEIVMSDAAKVPKSVLALTLNAAFFSIFASFVRATSERDAHYGALISFAEEVFALQKEADSEQALSLVESIRKRYLDPGASQPISAILDQATAASTTASLNEISEHSRSATPHSTSLNEGSGGFVARRHVYDGLLSTSLEALEAGCLQDFLQSSHYGYLMELKLKEDTQWSMEYFQVTRKLGSGGFGQVVEVVKRDCGKRYAMKVMKKAHIVEAFGDLWEAVILLERNVAAKLHHPLLINLAYSFQNIEYLWLVMDLCDGGDLGAFGHNASQRLTKTQLHFVGLEVLAVLAHLYEQTVLYRDLKPDNLLLDAHGHVRLIDFGTAKVGAEGATEPPTSTEECGSRPYMAPEIENVEESGQRYGCACDYYSFGVLLYELAEGQFPFGAHPAYEDLVEEYRQPELLDENGVEVPHLYDLLSGLLDWDPKTRLGGSAKALKELKADPYWKGADWELVNHGTLPSPLADYVQQKICKEEGSFKATNAPDKNAEEIHKQLHASELLQAEVDAAIETECAGGKLTSTMESLIEQEASMSVEGWEFVSGQALAQEYMATRATEAQRPDDRSAVKQEDAAKTDTLNIV